MDPLSAIGAASSVIGVASFGVQLSQVLYQFTSQAISAKQSLQTILSGIHATTCALNQVHGTLAEECDNLKQKGRAILFSAKAIDDVKGTADKCLLIFWRIEATITSKSGSKLEEELVRRLIAFNHELITKKCHDPIKVDSALVSLTTWGRLRWPLIAPKLDNYNSQLQLLQMNLVLMFSVVSLHAHRLRPAQREEDLRALVEAYTRIRRMAAQPEFAQITPKFGPSPQDSVEMSTSKNQTQLKLESPAPKGNNPGADDLSWPEVTKRLPARPVSLSPSKRPGITRSSNPYSNLIPKRELGSTATKKLPHSDNASFAVRMAVLGSVGSVTGLGNVSGKNRTVEGQDKRGIDGVTDKSPTGFTTHSADFDQTMPKEHQTTVSSGQNEFPNSQASPLISDREANTDQCSTGSRTHQDLGVANIRLAIDSTTAGAAVVAGAHEQDPENRLLTPGSFPEDLEQGKLNKMTVDDQISAVHVAQPDQEPALQISNGLPTEPHVAPDVDLYLAPSKAIPLEPQVLERQDLPQPLTATGTPEDHDVIGEVPPLRKRGEESGNRTLISHSGSRAKSPRSSGQLPYGSQSRNPFSRLRSVFDGKQIVTNAFLTAYIIKEGEAYEVPHPGIWKLKRKEITSITYQSSEKSWYKIFACMNEYDMAALQEVLAKGGGGGDEGTSSIVQLKKLKESRLKFWASHQAIFAIIRDSSAEVSSSASQSRRDIEESLLDIAGTERPPIAPPVTVTFGTGQPAGLISPSATTNPGGSTLPQRRWTTTPVALLQPPLPPPAITQPTGARRSQTRPPPPPVPANYRIPPPPPPTTAFNRPIYQQSTRLHYLSTPNTLKEYDCRIKLTTYAAFTIRKELTHNLDTEPPSWAQAEITEERLPQKAILQQIKKLDDRDTLTLVEKKADLEPYQEGQVTALIDRLAKKELDPAFEWLLVQLDCIKKSIKNVAGGRKRYQLETTILAIYLSRAPRPSLNPVIIYQNIQRMETGFMRPQLPPLSGTIGPGSLGRRLSRRHNIDAPFSEAASRSHRLSKPTPQPKVKLRSTSNANPIATEATPLLHGGPRDIMRARSAGEASGQSTGVAAPLIWVASVNALGQSAASASSEDEYEIDSQGRFILDAHGNKIRYRYPSDSDSDEYTTDAERRREIAYLQQYDQASGVEYGSGATTTSGRVATSHPTIGEPVNHSGQIYGSGPAEWAAVPRHHHPTRLSDVLEEGEMPRANSDQRIRDPGDRCASVPSAAVRLSDDELETKPETSEKAYVRDGYSDYCTTDGSDANSLHSDGSIICRRGSIESKEYRNHALAKPTNLASSRMGRHQPFEGSFIPPDSPTQPTEIHYTSRTGRFVASEAREPRSPPTIPKWVATEGFKSWRGSATEPSSRQTRIKFDDTDAEDLGEDGRDIVERLLSEWTPLNQENDEAEDHIVNDDEPKLSASKTRSEQEEIDTSKSRGRSPPSRRATTDKKDPIRRATVKGVSEEGDENGGELSNPVPTTADHKGKGREDDQEAFTDGTLLTGGRIEGSPTPLVRQSSQRQPTWLDPSWAKNLVDTTLPHFDDHI